MGDYQGLYYNEFISNKEVIKSFQNHDLPFKNGESINHLNKRIISEIVNICNNTKYDRIAIFSHSAAISNLKSFLLNEDYESIKMCCLIYKNNELKVLSYVPIKYGEKKLIKL
ncbi:MAG: histidine phosphatase family protein [Bacilli bacterium]